MAEVFKAKSFGVEGFEKVVVIKRILPELAESQKFVEMFIHEAKLAVRLSHANIVQVFDLGIAPAGDANERDAYYMAMEYVNGFDLATMLTRVRRQGLTLPLGLCVYIAAEVAKGLDHAHRRRDEEMNPLHIVHRDVSPQNVLLSLEGEVKVTDFGIAKARGALDRVSLEDTSMRTLQGKYGYMSPEQARGEDVDATSDLFSLGTLLYECASGVDPFSAPTTFETLRRVQACEVPPLELLRPDAPKEFIELVKMAMGKTPPERFPDAGRMHETLLTFLYSQNKRFGARDLADFLGQFRAPEDLALLPHLDTEPPTPNTLTPLAGSGRRARSSDHAESTDAAPPLGERREVTALVIAIPTRDSSLSQGMRSVSEQIVRRYGGIVTENQPEQVVALFGLGEPDGRDTEVATRCALVALRSMSGKGGPSAGLHTGRIHVSHSGEPKQDQRLSSLVQAAQELARTSEGECAASVAVADLVSHQFVCEATPEGTANLRAFFVRDVRRPAESFGRFVGRKDELRSLGEVMALATKRKTRTLSIRGDYGIGKTRLLVEVERRLKKGAYNVGWHMATCPPRGSELPLSGVVSMIQSLCGISDGDPESRVREVEPRLRALGLHTEEVAATLAVLGAATEAIPSDVSFTLRNAFIRMISSLAEDRLHVFAWDAAHSMDAESLAILGYAVSKLPEARIVFVLAARAGFSHPLESFEGHSAIDLADLRVDDVEKLVELRLGIDHAPEELLRFLRERASGHPQFIEEILSALLDARALSIADRAVVSMRLVGQELALPKTLRGLVSSRVSKLSEDDRRVVQAAAILGDPIKVSVLGTMSNLPMPTLERSLGSLRDRDIIVYSTPSEVRFTSPLIPEVIIDFLPLEARRAMHAAAGVALENDSLDSEYENASRIATHCYESGDQERAATYFGRSGEKRLEGRQLEAAARDFARAIELSDLGERSPEELYGWLLGLSSAVRLARTTKEAAALCDRVLLRIDTSGDLTMRITSRIEAGRILGAVHQFDAAWSQLAAAERMAEGDDLHVKSALAASLEIAARQGDFRRALSLLTRLESVVSSLGDRGEEHKVLLSLARTHAASGDRRAALLAVERAEELVTNDLALSCERQRVRGWIDFCAGDFRAASISVEKAVDLARGAGLSYEIALGLNNLGEALVRMGDFPRAYGALKQSVALCDETGFERLSNHNRMLLAFLDGAQGDAEGETLLRAGVDYAAAHDLTGDLLSGRYFLAQLLERASSNEAALVEYTSARELARSSGNRLLESDCDAGLQRLA